MKIGDKAPEILGMDAQGNEIRLSDYAGRKIVLYFYPKDNTSGCTAEACSLRDGYEELRAAGYEVIADTDLQLNNAFGVWREKKMCGRVGMGTVRTTFIIDENGVVADIIEKVKTADHSNQILNNK